MEINLQCPICTDNTVFICHSGFIKHCTTEKHFSHQFTAIQLAEQHRIDQFKTICNLYNIPEGIKNYLNSDHKGRHWLAFKALEEQHSNTSIPNVMPWP